MMWTHVSYGTLELITLFIILELLQRRREIGYHSLSAANVGTMAGAAYAPCPETIASGGNLLSGQSLPSDCTAADTSVHGEMTGTYLPGMSGGDSRGAEASAYGHMTGTYLPGTSGGDSFGAEASVYGQMTGTYLPGMSGGDSLGAQASASAAKTQAP